MGASCNGLPAELLADGVITSVYVPAGVTSVLLCDAEVLDVPPPHPLAARISGIKSASADTA